MLVVSGEVLLCFILGDLRTFRRVFCLRFQSLRMNNMSLQKYAFFALLCLGSVFGVSAQTASLSGVVKDAYTNELLPFTNIVVYQTTTGTTSNEEGRFVFENLSPGFVRLQVSSLGYEPLITEEIMLSAVRRNYFEVVLTPTNQQLDEVRVVASPFASKIESPLSLQRIGVDIIEKGAGSARDLAKVLQSFPGVGSTTSFRNDLIVRGGGPSENRFFLDGIEIPVLNHFSTQGASGGPISLLNVDFIREVDFYSGAFPAARGNALSSVFELKQIDPNPEATSLKATLGASEVSLSANTPLTERTSALFSVRRSYLNFLFDIIGLPFLPTYNDFQFVTRTKINQRNELTFLGVGAIDEFALNTGLEPTEENRYILSYLPVFEQWNYTLGASYKHFYSSSYSVLSVSRSHLYNTIYKYRDNDESSPDKLISDYKSDEIENKLRFEYFANPGAWTFSTGANAELATYTNATLANVYRGDALEQIAYDSRLNIFKWGLYASASRRVWDERLALSGGLRLDASNYGGSMNNPLEQLSPRASASFTLLPSLLLNASVGRYYQLPAYTTLGYRNGEGVLENRENGLRYIRADHFVGGLEWRISSSLRATLEGFDKRYADYPVSVVDGISLASKGADYGVLGDEEVLSIGSGRSYGFEFLLQQRTPGGLNYLLAYTWVQSRFSDLEGNSLPSSWDSGHLLTATLTQALPRNWDVGFKWRYIGALPYTPIDRERSELKEAWDVRGREYLDYDRFNGERLDPFHQLDVRVDKSFYFSRFSLGFYLDIQNVYAFESRNAPRLLQERDENDAPILQGTDPERYRLKELQTYSGTFLPSVGVILEF